MLDKLEKETILRLKPQINRSNPSALRMWLVSLCAFVTIMQSSLSDSFSSLLVTFAAVSVAELAEFLFYFRTEKQAMPKDGSAIASAFILTLLLPNYLNPLYVALGVFFTMLVVKYSFGGLGANWLNPAIGGWLFIRFSWPAAFEEALNVNPASLGTNGVNNIGRWISDTLNTSIFHVFGVELPQNYITLFAYSGSGIIIDRGLFAFLLGTIIIGAFQVSRIWIPVAYLCFYAFLVKVSGNDLFLGLFSGGIMVTAFLLVADSATSPKSRAGSLIVAILAACLSWLFRYHGGEPYGAFFAVALLNVLVPVIRRIESHLFYRGMS
ncbi:MAG: RnfABCDGE type electron transport complex subunit D [Treponema sp.]|jgi:Na+-translocating ferredoxin:NAD+ oxidoreductase RnfD subunit|nr:RnfABCDGE type electron transport complex subunit D [Treponema sp.]